MIFLIGLEVFRFEVSKPEEVFDFYKQRGYSLQSFENSRW